MRWPFKLALGIIAALVIAALLRPGGRSDGQVDLASHVFKATKYEYDQLQTGMSYADAIRVIGEPGEEISRNEIVGISTVMYMWRNWDGSNMNAMFQNGGLVQKAQFGLK